MTFLVLFLFGSFTAYSCSCDYPSQRSAFRNAETVFVGEVVEFKALEGRETNEDLIWFPYQVTFKVEKQWKGKRQAQIIARTDLNIGPCSGFEMSVGERFLIYAERKSGQLTFWRGCSRNARAENAKGEIKRLGNFFFRAYTFLYPFPKV